MAENTPLYETISNVYNGPALGVPNRDLFGQGIVGASDLAVSAHVGANSVDVAAGVCWVVGDTDPLRQPTYRCFNDAIVNLGISPDPTNPRQVRVVAQVNDADFVGGTRNWQLVAIHGTPAASPAIPAEPASAFTLATILVPAAAASSAAYTITDARARAQIGAGQVQLLPMSMTIIQNGTVSYTAPAGTATVEIDAVGAGGGGGGAATVASASGSGAGGGGGGYAHKLLVSNIGTHTVAVGLGGPAGAAGANAGTAGGNTTFADTTAAVVCQANGGAGGSGGTATVTLNTWTGGNTGGGNGVTGDILELGEFADLGQTFGVITTAVNGRGGRAGGPYGGVGGGLRSTGGVGAAGGNYGGGGSGGMIVNGSAAAAGGAGANGVLVVRANG